MNLTSIMLVTYNRLNLTKRMLDSLIKNTDSPYRLIIVDNGSKDGTVEWLKEFSLNKSFPIHLHFNDENLGIAAGRNRAMKIADQFNDPWLSTVDNDVEFIPNWLSKCLDVLNFNEKFAVGLNMEGVDYPITNLNGKNIQFKKSGNLGTACTVFPRALHDEIGFFVSYGLYGEEDSDFFIRSRVVGYGMGYLLENGVHFGTGENDIGEYRDWKTKMHAENLVKFRKACNDYYYKIKPIYVPDPFLNEGK